MATTIDVSAMVTEWEQFCLNNEQNQTPNAILQLPYEATDTLEQFPLQITDNQGVVRRSEVQQDRILQPFQTGFTPIGTTEFVPHEIALYRLKIDLEFYPDQLYATWQGFLADPKLLDRSQWPFVRWYIEKVLMPRHLNDLEQNEAFLGVYAAPTPGTAGAASTAINGVKKLINLGIAAGTDPIVPFTLGVPSNDPETFVEYIESFVNQIPERYRSMKMDICMSQVLMRRFREGMRKKYNINWSQVQDLAMVMDYDNFTIKGLASHTGSNKIWATPEWNKARFVNGFDNISNVRVETQKRAVHIFTDYEMGIGFWCNPVVFTNDQETS